jgi:RNA polymerase sigma-70 factor (ECF subfamily)
VATDLRVARLERLAKEHSTEIANYLRRRLYPLSPSELDDLVEEVLLVVWRRIDAVPADAELPWMIGVARNVLNNARRSHSRREAFTATLEPRGTDSSAEEYVVADLAVREALSSLSASDREVLLLHFWDGLDAGALATVLSVTANAAAVRLSRAQTRFRTALERAK